MVITPFEGIAGVVGIYGVTVHTLRLLWEEIEAIKDAPKEIVLLKTELQELEQLIVELALQIESSPNALLSSEAKTRLELALTKCDDACAAFREKLKKWTVRSGEGPLHWTDRLYVALRGQKKLQTMLTRLQACKGTIIALTTTANLIVSARAAEMTTVVHNRLLEENRTIRQRLTDIDDERKELICTRNEREQDDEKIRERLGMQVAEFEGTRDASWAEVVEDDERAEEELGSYKEVLEEVSSKVQQAVQKFQDVQAKQSMVGMFNMPEGGQREQHLTRVKADRSIVGMANNVTIPPTFFGTPARRG